jgi:Prp8 binding protein
MASAATTMMGQEPQLPPSKRMRGEEGGALTVYHQVDTNHHNTPLRTSSLQSPTMRLTGHKSSVYCLAYDNVGDCLCSGSFDKTALLWNASASGAGDDDGNSDYANYNVLEGHKNAILDIKFNMTNDNIVTASADKTLGWYDALTGTRVKRFSGHDGVVNAVDVPRAAGGAAGAESNANAASSGAPFMVVSASDDCTVRLWDARVGGGKRGHVLHMQHDYQVTAVALSVDANTVYTGGIDNHIHAFDIRQGTGGGAEDDEEDKSKYSSLSQGGAGGGQRIMTMKGHKDTITSLSTSHNGNYLLSQSMDGTLKSWDIRPFVPEGQKRCLKTFQGATHNAERGLLKCSWSADGSMVSGGSADRVVHIWDEYSSDELYVLPGHSGCVNSVIFHPCEKNVVASASSDKTIYVGELAS